MGKRCAVIGVDRADSPQAKDIVSGLFDRIVLFGQHDKYLNTYSIPPLYKIGSRPEYLSWFEFHGISVPDDVSINIGDVRYSEVYGEFDYVIWGGCKPAWKSKQWPYWGSLAERLLSKGMSVATVGVAGDGGDFPSGVTDFRGKLSLLETGGVIVSGKKYIGNEGGITHYANALQSDMWVVWGGTDPVKNTPPKRSGYKLISLGLDCQPCQWTSGSPAFGCKSRRCLNDLLPEDVLGEIL